MTNDAVMRKTQVPKAQNLGTIFKKRHVMAAPANLCRESHTPLGTAFGGRRLDSLPLLKRTTERLGYALLESMKHPLAQEWKLSATIHHTLDEF